MTELPSDKLGDLDKFGDRSQVRDQTEPVGKTELVDAVRALSRLSRIIERASDELSWADYRLMSAISGGEARASRLASRLLLGKPTISSTVESLSKRGLIVKSTVDGDNRAIELSLSDEGAELFARMEARMVRQLELLAERTPDRRQAVQSLGWFAVVIEESMAAHAQELRA
jgi:DNA-binding MarR family transcriptional regulator